MSKHFCTCAETHCPQHPQNHGKGCDPCIADNLAKNKMPACFFRLVDEDISTAPAYNIEGFVQFYQMHDGGNIKKNKA